MACIITICVIFLNIENISSGTERKGFMTRENFRNTMSTQKISAKEKTQGCYKNYAKKIERKFKYNNIIHKLYASQSLKLN